MVSASLLLEDGKEEWNLVTLIPEKEGGQVARTPALLLQRRRKV